MTDPVSIISVTEGDSRPQEHHFTVKTHINDTTPAQTGGTVVITDSEGAQAGKPTMAKNGTWTWKANSLLTDGEYTITTTKSDGSSVIRTFIVDTSTPTNLEINSIESIDDKAFGNTTVITGSVEGAKGGTVTVSSNGKVIGKPIVDEDGKWELELETGTNLESGSHNITATVTSKTGVTADMAAPVEFTVKPQPPATTEESTEETVDTQPNPLSAGEEPVFYFNSPHTELSTTTSTTQTESGIKVLNLALSDLLPHSEEPLLAEVEKTDNANSAANDDNSNKDILTAASLEKDMADAALSVEGILHDALNTSSNGLQLIITQEEVSVIS